MTKIFDRAKLALSDLSEEDQNALVEQLEDAAAVRKLRAMIAEGRASIERGEAAPLDIESLIGELNEAHAGP